MKKKKDAEKRKNEKKQNWKKNMGKYFLETPIKKIKKIKYTS